MSSTRLSLTVVVFASITWPSAAAAEEPTSDIEKRVNTHLERGVEFYAEKQYELAIVEFRAGYGLDPRPELLFALAQAERLSGDCPTAVAYYQRFLETTPDSNQAEAARVNMRRCKRALESGVGGRPPAPAEKELEVAEQASEPAPAAVPAGTANRGIRERPGRDRSGWYRDPVGGSLAAGSAVGLGLGVGFWIAKAGAEADARAANGYDEHQDALSRARRARTIALVSGGVGAALAVAATYRYLTFGNDRRGASLSATPAAGGGAVSLSGWF